MEGWQPDPIVKQGTSLEVRCVVFFTFFSVFFLRPGQIFFVIKYFSIDGNVTN